MSELIRFDWAMKRLLRNKANYGVLEGFLTVLLNEKIKIQTILESESNQDDPRDKMNRVDMLVENENGEMILIEVQNAREADFISRVLYGASKVITEYIHLGESYSKIKKVICVSIVYFDLGRGHDYVYHGKTHFRGLHDKDELALNEHEQRLYPRKQLVSDVYPEYYIIKVNEFDTIAKNSLDEWIYFLKTEKIESNFTAPGLQQAQQVLAMLKLDPKERKQYQRYLESLSYEASTLGHERELGKIEGKTEATEEIALRMLRKGLSIEDVAELTGLSSHIIKAIQL